MSMATENSKPRGRPRGSKIDPYRSDVGVLTDAEVAKKAGVSVSAVKLYRDRHKIPPALPQGATRRARDRKAGGAAAASTPPAERTAPPAERRGPGRKSKIQPLHHLVGALSDAEVAKQAGVTANAVQMYRKKHGIAPAGAAAGAPRGRRPGRPARAAVVVAAVARRRGSPPKAAAAAASSGGRGLYGWRIRVANGKSEEVRIAVAANAAAACAAGAALGEVVGLERLAEAMV
jgi:hypothetical protein